MIENSLNIRFNQVVPILISIFFFARIDRSLSILIWEEIVVSKTSYREFYGFPKSCKSIQNEDRGSIEIFREKYQACQDKAVIKRKLTFDKLLTNSMEFCCYLKDILGCEIDPLKSCDEQYASNSEFEIKIFLNRGCDPNLVNGCEGEKWFLNSNFIIGASLGTLFLLVLSLFSFIYVPIRKLFVATIFNRPMSPETYLFYYQEAGWRKKFLCANLMRRKLKAVETLQIGGIDKLYTSYPYISNATKIHWELRRYPDNQAAVWYQIKTMENPILQSPMISNETRWGRFKKKQFGSNLSGSISSLDDGREKLGKANPFFDCSNGIGSCVSSLLQNLTFGLIRFICKCFIDCARMILRACWDAF
ncbi:hypothetical protein QR98_0064380 [Sarcoptes scabiei]|uniref:Uncharacterized protein n=1 Tax=Sarcoptes scabiei TaxID=52283 RepID=A0A132AAB4_SARSC|nr:hypothetical protein QR98_0064380 [Sarcoptes scabiei]